MIAFFKSIVIRKGQNLVVGLLFGVLLAGLLTACGTETATTTDYTVPVLTGLEETSNVASKSDFRNKILLPKQTDVTDQDVRVYSTDRKLADLQTAYRDEMTKRGWTNATSNITGSTELGSQGVIEAFEKTVGGDVNKKHVAGLLMVAADFKNDLTDSIRSQGKISADKNLVIIIQGAVGITTPTAAAK